MISIDIPASELNETFWETWVTNRSTGARSPYFEFAIRMTVDYPMVEFHVYVPRNGAFENMGLETTPSQEELAKCVIARADLEASGAVNVAMRPYNERQVHGCLSRDSSPMTLVDLPDGASPRPFEPVSLPPRVDVSGEEQQPSNLRLFEHPRFSVSATRPTHDTHTQLDWEDVISLAEESVRTNKRGGPQFREDVLPMKKKKFHL